MLQTYIFARRPSSRGRVYDTDKGDTRLSDILALNHLVDPGDQGAVTKHAG